MNKILKIISLLINNPVILYKRCVAEIRSVCLWAQGSVQKKINGVLFDFDFNYNSVIKNMYVGKYEIEVREIMKKILRKGDVFIDVGANIGYLSAIAAGFVGETGEVHSFEPVPEYFQRLQKMASINKEYKIIVNQYALGENNGSVMISVTRSPNIGWNTIVPAFMSEEDCKQKFTAPIHRLDNYIKEKGLNKVSLIKIDVEGFEFPVLKGLKNFLADKSVNSPILCEIAPSAYPLLGCNLVDIFNYMQSYNYSPVRLDNINRKLDYSSLNQTTNVLFRRYL